MDGDSMTFKPRLSTGILVGIAIIISLSALDALLLSYLRWGQINLVFFIFALLVRPCQVTQDFFFAGLSIFLT